MFDDLNPAFDVESSSSDEFLENPTIKVLARRNTLYNNFKKSLKKK